MYQSIANEDFWNSYRRAFWRKLVTNILGKENQLLPYDAVRAELPFLGQRYLGLQTIPLDKIVGSVGRYRDFDRAFLPINKSNNQRWINIQVARYEDVELPPIDVYKIGDVYFVKDGNHRVSVARKRSQFSIDAIVTEIDVPISLTSDIGLAEIQQKRTYAEFIQQTRLAQHRQNVDLELSLPDEYGRLLDHIQKHQFYLGLEQSQSVSFETAVLSWYDTVYLPLVNEIKSNELDKQFPNRTLTDLYWWVSEYQWLRKESTIDEDKVEQEAHTFFNLYNQTLVQQIINKLRQATWIDHSILKQEQDQFFEYTKINDIRPEANIELTLPGKYEKLLQHISEHRWYLGEQNNKEILYETAVASWFDHIYLPIIDIIKTQRFMDRFPKRTETDLYLWTIDHRGELEEAMSEIEKILE